MREFLNRVLEEDFKVIKIEKEVSAEYEVAKILREHPKDVLIFENVKGYDMKIISGICNTRDKIARGISVTVPEITKRIMKATENPIPVKNVENIKENFNTQKEPDLSKIPVPTYYKKDGGAYITAGVVIAKDPETGIRNASIHRMLVSGKDKLGIRIVPRNLYTYYKKAEEMDKPLDIAIAIGMHPATLLATTTSVPITTDELEVANNFHNGNMKLIKCESVDLDVPDAEIIMEGKILPHEREPEGPFVDLTDTYDVVREEPIININKIHYKKDPFYHAIMPAGFEHRLLQGLPQEPRIYNAVLNTVPTVQNVVLTEGGCCWLHAAVSIKKQTQGDGKNVLMAALAAHPSLKHAIVVDEDVDIFDPEDLEYAIATRVKGDDDIMIVPGARGSSLDPCAKPDGTTTKIGVDATKPLDKLEKFERVSFSE
ncbi:MULTISPECIES: UbiD family decarboxylase [Methanobacterium]|jgi:UbiD family decarboxylase|uniref:Anhydromevalonate phosphate decarboxylase n=1 Tax=Methanobacterium veterum TaxID=408577 RepID=A0A9E5DP62_9EURY|nr:MULTISPECIES: UbiD family decarboxylase [Methanobacterium]MCZ3365510.1 UbiD family decarboxylase [Methanobacterium veterum]MCZ3373262.1 UbiD family decarboxylase [Methanobacterium veterum]